MRRLNLYLVMLFYNLLHGFVDTDPGSLCDTVNSDVICSCDHSLRSVKQYSTTVLQNLQCEQFICVSQCECLEQFIIGQKCTSSVHQTAYFSVCWEPFETHRLHCRLNMFYKITRGMVELRPEYHPVLRHQLAARGHSQQFQHLQPSVDAYRYAFFPRTIPVWNALPVELVESNSLEAFKLHLQSLQ